MSQAEDELGDLQWCDDPPSVDKPSRIGVGVHDIGIADYLADPCPGPSLRSGGVNLLLPDISCPAEFKALHPRLTDFSEYARKKATKEMDRGSVVHCLILGVGTKVCVLDPRDFPTERGEPSQTFGSKLAKAAKKEAEDRGDIVMTPEQMSGAEKIAAIGRARLAGWLGAWPSGEIERTFVWQEESGYGPVWCMTRPDIWIPEIANIVDIKVPSGGLSDPDIDRALADGKGRTIMQAAWQRRGAMKLFPELADRITHSNAFLDPDPPYLGRRIFITESALADADRRCDRAIRTFGWCLSTGQWPEWEDGRLGGAQWLHSQWAAQENKDEMGDADSI